MSKLTSHKCIEGHEHDWSKWIRVYPLAPEFSAEDYEWTAQEQARCNNCDLLLVRCTYDYEAHRDRT